MYTQRTCTDLGWPWACCFSLCEGFVLLVFSIFSGSCTLSIASSIAFPEFLGEGIVGDIYLELNASGPPLSV